MMKCDDIWGEHYELLINLAPVSIVASTSLHPISFIILILSIFSCFSVIASAR